MGAGVVTKSSVRWQLIPRFYIFSPSLAQLRKKLGGITTWKMNMEQEKA